MFELDRQAFTNADLTSRTEIVNWSAGRAGWFGFGVEIPSGLDTAERTVFDWDLTIEPASTQLQEVHGSDNKRVAGDTSFVRRALAVLPVNSGDQVRLFLASQNANDTAVSGDGLVFADQLDLIAYDTVANSFTPTKTKFALTSFAQTDDLPNRAIVQFLNGNLKWQRRMIADYTGSTRVIELNQALPQAPAAGDDVAILGLAV